MTTAAEDRIDAYRETIANAPDIQTLDAIAAEFTKEMTEHTIRRSISVIQDLSTLQGLPSEAAQRKVAVAVLSNEGVTYRLCTAYSHDAYQIMNVDISKIGRNPKDAMEKALAAEVFIGRNGMGSLKRRVPRTGSQEMKTLRLVSSLLRQGNPPPPVKVMPAVRGSSHRTVFEHLLDKDGGIAGPVSFGVMTDIRTQAVRRLMHAVQDRIEAIADHLVENGSDLRDGLEASGSLSDRDVSVTIRDTLSSPTNDFTFTQIGRGEQPDFIVLEHRTKSTHIAVEYYPLDGSVAAVDRFFDYAPASFGIGRLGEMLSAFEEVASGLDIEMEPEPTAQPARPSPAP